MTMRRQRLGELRRWTTGAEKRTFKTCPGWPGLRTNQRTALGGLFSLSRGHEVRDIGLLVTQKPSLSHRNGQGGRTSDNCPRRKRDVPEGRNGKGGRVGRCSARAVGWPRCLSRDNDARDTHSGHLQASPDRNGQRGTSGQQLARSTHIWNH